MTESELEKKNKKKAMLYTTIIQAVLFIVLFFIVAWRAPDPPIPEYGIELNFGMDDQGSGEVQPETPVGSQGAAEEQPEESQTEVKEEIPDVQEEIQEDIKPVEPTPAEEPIVSKVESPVVVKEKKEEVKPVEKPVEKTEEKKAEPKVEPKVVEKKVEEKPKVNPEAVYKPKANQGDAAAKSTDTKQGTAGNHGDDPGKTGDKGDPKGTLNADALYGKPGGGAGGTSLDLDGWKWDEIPKPNVPNNVTGVIIFEISVNARGELERIIVLRNDLTPEAAKACRNAVEKLTFTKTGTNVPTLSKGKITFVVRAE